MPRHIDFTKQPTEVRLAAHAIGLDNKRPYQRYGKFFYRPYRNYYQTHDKAPEYRIWKGLCENKYATFFPSGGRGSYYFNRTRAGLDWLGRQLQITIHDEEQ